jgi:isopentenyl-diphosphate Delta-isomerase
MDKVILVNQDDQVVGEMEKMEAHVKGVLHRAFSVFLFNDAGELLLQQRAFSKYHSGGLWTNTCCSHPAPGEEVVEAALRRLNQELGIQDVEVEIVHHFLYKAEFENGLTEHEFDYVLKGKYNGVPILNNEEVESVRWISMQQLRDEIISDPDRFTFWFRELIKQQIF